MCMLEWGGAWNGWSHAVCGSMQRSVCISSSHRCPALPACRLPVQVKQSALLRYAYLAAFLRHYSPDIYAEVGAEALAGVWVWVSRCVV